MGKTPASVVNRALPSALSRAFDRVLAVAGSAAGRALAGGRVGHGHVLAGIGVTDVVDHGAEQQVVFRYFAVFDVAANKIAEHAAEIFVARVRHE